MPDKPIYIEKKKKKPVSMFGTIYYFNNLFKKENTESLP